MNKKNLIEQIGGQGEKMQQLLQYYLHIAIALEAILYIHSL